MSKPHTNLKDGMFDEFYLGHDICILTNADDAGSCIITFRRQVSSDEFINYRIKGNSMNAAVEIFRILIREAIFKHRSYTP